MLPTTPAAANLLAGTSSNPLDDLVSIFGGMGGSGGAPNGGGGLGGLDFGGGGFGSPVMQATSPQATGGLSAFAAPTAPPQAQQPQEDLLGLF